MLYAHNHLGEKIEAHPGASGWCPLCTAPLNAKCGDINIWHWAHTGDNPNPDCIHEKETEWHSKWKSYYPMECREVVVTCPATNKRNIADIKEKSGLVIEFQHSPISPETIQQRERAHKNMIWVFNLTDAYDNDRLRWDPHYGTFYWFRSKKTLLSATADYYFDLGNGYLLRPKNIRECNGGHRGDGYLVSYDSFVWETSSTPFYQHVKYFPQ